MKTLITKSAIQEALESDRCLTIPGVCDESYYRKAWLQDDFSRLVFALRRVLIEDYHGLTEIPPIYLSLPSTLKQVKKSNPIYTKAGVLKDLYSRFWKQPYANIPELPYE